MSVWTPEQDDYLLRHYMTVDYKDIAKTLGKSVGAVRNRRYAKLPRQVPAWTAEELSLLRSEYEGKQYSEQIDLDGLSAVIGKHKTNISRKARELGLTNIRRRTKEVADWRCSMSAEQHRRYMSTRVKKWMSENNHPRGMLGKKHSAETLAEASARGRQRWAEMAEGEKSEKLTKMLRRKIEVHGRVPPNVQRGSWKAGWREIGGDRNYYRSRWEANYARYLQWLKERGEIRDWQHEPETFWFEAIKRGVRSYLPDFKVTETNGSVAYHEVKGWMDDRSRTTIKRMAKYHPTVKLIVVDAKQYRALRVQLCRLVPGWE